MCVAIEKLKQWIVAIVAKVRIFQRNQRQFYGELNQDRERCDDDKPVAEELKRFWGDIKSESVDHNTDAKWLNNLMSENCVKKQEKEKV